MANEKDTPPVEILDYARVAFDMPKAGPVALLRRAATVLKVGSVSEYPYSCSRLILSAVKSLNEVSR